VHRLLYYDKITPVDYEPKYFKHATWEEPFAFDTSPVKIKVGEIRTPYHALSMRLRTTVDLFEDEEDQMVSEDKGGKKCQVESDSSSESEHEDQINTPITQRDETSEEDQYPFVKEAVLEAGGARVSFIKSKFPKLSNSSINRFLVRMVQDKVLQLQDGEYKIVISSASSSTTPRVNNAHPEEIYKDALKALTNEEYMTVPKLRMKLNTNNAMARELMKRLEQEGLVSRSTNGNKGRKVIERQESSIPTVSAVRVKGSPFLGKQKQARPKTSSLKRKLEGLELADSQDAENETAKCSITAKPLAQKRKTARIEKEE